MATSAREVRRGSARIVPFALAALAACSSSGAPAPLCTGPEDDGVACTVDACDPAVGASHVPSDALCPPDLACSATAGCLPRPPTCADLPRAAGTAIRLEPLALGTFDTAIVDVSAPAGDARRLFVVEQVGRVWLVEDGVRAGVPYLDLTGRVLHGGERGLFSIAFHPGFAENGKLYVNYTAVEGGGDVVVSELTAPDPAAGSADPASEVVLLVVEHSAHSNHNGGRVAFGPDGLLFASVGDGGGVGDPLGSGQDPDSLLGKLLRIDPAAPATPAPGNPFGNAVYDLGLRNPWRFAFDRETGDLYLGDVGQGAWEEIDHKAAPGPGEAPPAGTNWGWKIMEGHACYSPATGCDPTGLALPILDYSHADGCSVTGGFVYRGVALPDLAATGTYFYGDYCGGWVRTLRVVDGVATSLESPFSGLGNVFSFGEDGCGELHVIAGRTVLKVVPAT